MPEIVVSTNGVQAKSRPDYSYGSSGTQIFKIAAQECLNGWRAHVEGSHARVNLTPDELRLIASQLIVLATGLEDAEVIRKRADALKRLQGGQEQEQRDDF